MITKAFNKRDVWVSATVASATHKPGDRYHAEGKFYRLHQQRSANGPRAHFEYEPRWN